MRQLALIFGFLVAFAVQAMGQPFPQTLPPNTVFGRLGISPGPGQAIPFATLQARLNPTTVFTPSAYGARCDGASDDTTALKALGAAVAANGGNGIIAFPPGANCLTFNSGQAFSASLGTIFDFSGGVSNVIVQGNNATITNNHTFTGSDTLYVFYCNCTNFSLENLKFVQTNAVSLPSATPIGTVGVWNFAGANFNATGITLTGGEAPILLSNTDRIVLDNITSTNSIYGLAANTNNGAGPVMNLTVRGLVVNGTAHDRALFLKGVSGADIWLSSLNAGSNDVLISSEASGQITENINLNYTIKTRTAGTPNTYLTIGLGTSCTTACANSIFRNITVNINADLSGDASLGPLVKIIKSSTSALGLTFENIRISGKVSGVPAAAGNLFDLFTSADAPWTGETATNISLENLYVTGSSTPGFFVDFAPFPTLTTGHLSIRNFWMTGNYSASNSSNEATQLNCLVANWGNKTCVLQAAVGGTGLFEPTTHRVLISQGSSPFTLVALPANMPLIGASGADPVASTIGYPTSLTSGGILYGSSTTQLASSGLLAANQIVLGGGAGTTPATLGSLGTTTTVLHGNAAGAPTFAAVVSADLNITTTTCTNQFLTAISATGTGTCTTATLASAQFANQGTTTTVLHGNAAGNPSFAAIANADLTNSTITLNAGTGVGLTTPGSVALGATGVIGATTDAVKFGTLSLGSTIGTATLAVTGAVADTNQAIVANISPTLNFTTGSNITQFGMQNTTATSVTGGSNLTSIVAFFQNQLNVQSSATLALGVGFRTRIAIAGASPTGTITDDAAAEIAAPAIQSSGTPSLTISAHRGLWIRNQGISSAGITSTASYGLYMDAQSGSTTSYMAWFNSASPDVFFASGGLNIGTNTDPGAGIINAKNGFNANGTAGVSTVCTVTAGNSYTFTFGLLTTKGANCT